MIATTQAATTAIEAVMSAGGDTAVTRRSGAIGIGTTAREEATMTTAAAAALAAAAGALVTEMTVTSDELRARTVVRKVVVATAERQSAAAHVLVPLTTAARMRCAAARTRIGDSDKNVLHLLLLFFPFSRAGRP